MVRSLRAAMAGNGEAAAARRGHLRRCFSMGAWLALLGACSTVPPADAPVPPPTPLAAAALPLQPAAAHLPDMRKLTGLSAAEVVALFGEPDFRRAEPPAELWQYRGADCVLDLFIYRDAGGAHVRHSEARDRSLVKAGTGSCAGGGEALVGRARQSRL